MIQSVQFEDEEDLYVRYRPAPGKIWMGLQFTAIGLFGAGLGLCTLGVTSLIYSVACRILSGIFPSIGSYAADATIKGLKCIGFGGVSILFSGFLGKCLEKIAPRPVYLPRHSFDDEVKEDI